MALLMQGSCVTGVRTHDGVVPAGAMVIAAGLGSARLAMAAGLRLPIVVTREQELILEAPRRRHCRGSW
jgi:glycine/D-amino acid oxidase-like deaminating enzyme